MKKTLKIISWLLLAVILMKISIYGMKAFLTTKTDDWYFLTFENKTQNEQHKFAKEHTLKIIEINKDYLLIKSKSEYELLKNNEIEEVCRFAFEETHSSKHILSANLNDQTCNVKRKSYMENHPFITSFMKGFNP